MNKQNTPSRYYYDMNNEYLNSLEKKEVEMWFQLPGNFLQYTICFLFLYSTFYQKITYSQIFLYAISLNLIIGVINWLLYSKRLVFYLYLTIFHSWILYLVGFSTGVILLTQKQIVGGLFCILYTFGTFSFLEVHMFLYSLFSKKYGLHTKYAFFKKWYKKKFSFEA